jgi:hypothetical protein
MTSMGVSPRVNWRYTDLDCTDIDGILLQLIDKIQRGVVDWPKPPLLYGELTDIGKVRLITESLDRLIGCNIYANWYRCLPLNISLSEEKLQLQKLLKGFSKDIRVYILVLMKNYLMNTGLEGWRDHLIDGPCNRLINVSEAEVNGWVQRKLGLHQAEIKRRGITQNILDLIDKIKPGKIEKDLFPTRASME